MRVACLCAAVVAAAAWPVVAAEPALTVAEQAFLDLLDAHGAAGYIESGAVDRFDGRDLDAWRQADAAREGSTRTRGDARDARGGGR